ncbi:hypothetical protein JW887_01290 [Candidatus Dojkabacteria bacterium]|nr:hypothetical protein [Candidatus Dojkabacteria bacterium]
MKVKNFIYSILLLVSSGLLLSSCSKDGDTTNNQEDTDILTSATFANVCNGVAVSDAAEYSTESGDVSPIYVFSRNSQNDSYISAYGKVPSDWEPNISRPEEAQLVACVTVIESSDSGKCEYDGDNETFTLNTYDAKYKVSLYNAKTAELVAETEFDLSYDDCPTDFLFTSSENDDYAAYGYSLTDFARQYVEH